MLLSGSPLETVAAIAAAEVAGVSVKYVGGEGEAVLQTSEGELRGRHAVLRYVARLVPAASLYGGSSFEAAEVESWVSFAGSELRPFFEGALGADKLVLEALVGMGVRFSAFQSGVYGRVLSLAGVERRLAALERWLGSRTFLVGENVSAADFAVFAAVFDVATLALFSSSATYPNVVRFVRTLSLHPAWQSASSIVGLRRGGLEREGGQIDTRPDVRAVAKAADFSIALEVERRAKGGKGKSVRKKGKQEGGAEKKKKSGGDGGDGGVGGAAGGGGSGVVATAEQPASNLEDLSAEESERKAMSILEKVGIDVSSLQVHHHDAAKDMETLRRVGGGLECTLCKNLFVKAKKPRDDTDHMLWMVIARDGAKVDLKQLTKELGYPSKAQIRFGKEELLRQNLGAVTGHLSPIHLANDTALRVKVVLDAALLSEPALGFHPLHNAATVVLKPDQLQALLEKSGHPPTVLEFNDE